MQKIVRTIVLGLMLFSFPGSLLFAAELHIRVSGLAASQGGTVLAGLYNTEEGFLDAGYQIASIAIPVTSDTVTGIFPDLPEGRYAVALFHDTDNDGEIDTGLFGIPKEGYGFSGPNKATTRPPSFIEGSLALGSNDSKVADITVKYF